MSSYTILAYEDAGPVNVTVIARTRAGFKIAVIMPRIKLGTQDMRDMLTLRASKVDAMATTTTPPNGGTEYEE